METWLVTGGAGFIGSWFIHEALQQTNVTLVVLDALTYAGSHVRLADSPHSSRIKFIIGDIRDKSLLESIFSQYLIDKVINFAAESHVDNSIEQPEEFISTNIHGTFTLLEVTRNAWQKRKPNHCFLQISTDEVYGELKTNEPKCHEMSGYFPRNPYAATKACADHLVYTWYHTYEMPIIITRSTNTYGPWQTPEKLVPIIIRNALSGSSIPINSDGEQKRDWLYVKDNANAILAILHRGKIGESYNISADNELSVLEMVTLIGEAAEKLNLASLEKIKSSITHVAHRKNDDRRYGLNNEKVKSEIAWQPTYSLQSGIEQTLMWYYHHLDWVGDMENKLKQHGKTNAQDSLADPLHAQC